MLKKKVIAHFHAFSPETTIFGPKRKVYQYLFGKADVVIVLSHFWKEKVNECFCLGEKVQVVYNPCTSEVFATEYPKKKQILYTGIINACKGYADMIRAFSNIAYKYHVGKYDV